MEIYSYSTQQRAVFLYLLFIYFWTRNYVVFEGNRRMGEHTEEVDIAKGLTAEQVARRQEKGLTNGQQGVVTKSVGQIVAGNLCTLFNLINGILAGLVIFTGSYKNALFMVVILCNLGVGIFQEIRAKKTIDKLSLISAPTAKPVSYTHLDVYKRQILSKST